MFTDRLHGVRRQDANCQQIRLRLKKYVFTFYAPTIGDSMEIVGIVSLLSPWWQGSSQTVRTVIAFLPSFDRSLVCWFMSLFILYTCRVFWSWIQVSYPTSIQRQSNVNVFPVNNRQNTDWLTYGKWSKQTFACTLSVKVDQPLMLFRLVEFLSVSPSSSHVESESYHIRHVLCQMLTRLTDWPAWKIAGHPRRHGTLTQCWANVGPSSTTLHQH